MVQFNPRNFNHNNYIAAVSYPDAPEPAFHIYLFMDRYHIFDWEFQFVDKFSTLDLAIGAAKKQIIN